MSPRTYQSVQRQATVEETRGRIIRAVHTLLGADGDVHGFTVDAVAREANVARMTVYYQFGSKAGLLEALCDYLAERGRMEQLSQAFRHADGRAALAQFVATFGQFWEADRAVTRRLRGFAALDPEFALVVRARDERRRAGLRVLVERLAKEYGHPAPAQCEQVVDVLYTLIGFEYFDILAGDQRPLTEVIPLVQRLAELALAL